MVSRQAFQRWLDQRSVTLPKTEPRAPALELEVR
jgi:hypothetical protein